MCRSMRATLPTASALASEQESVPWRSAELDKEFADRPSGKMFADQLNGKMFADLSNGMVFAKLPSDKVFAELRVRRPSADQIPKLGQTHVVDHQDRTKTRVRGAHSSRPRNTKLDRNSVEPTSLTAITTRKHEFETRTRVDLETQKSTKTRSNLRRWPPKPHETTSSRRELESTPKHKSPPKLGQTCVVGLQNHTKPRVRASNSSRPKGAKHDRNSVNRASPHANAARTRDLAVQARSTPKLVFREFWCAVCARNSPP